VSNLTEQAVLMLLSMCYCPEELFIPMKLFDPLNLRLKCMNLSWPHTQQREKAGRNLFLSRSQLLDIGITYQKNKKVYIHVGRFLNIQKRMKKDEKEETRT
jgi:hypothetical protein